MTTSTNKNILVKASWLKSGIRKDVTVSANQESMNKSNSANVFLRFSTLLKLLVVAYRGVFRTQWNIYDEAFCKNNEQLLTVNHFR